MISRIAYLVLALTFALLIVNSCDDAETCNCVEERHVGSIQILFDSPSDTIIFTPADSATLDITILVSDEHGDAMPGIEVEVSLVNTSFGVLEYRNAELQNRTDSQGRVELLFRTYAQAGDQVITASAEGVSASRNIVIRPTTGTPWGFIVTATPSTLEAGWDRIAISTISATILDAFNRGIPGQTIIFSADYGVLTESTLTDSSGYAQCYWIAEDISGEFWIRARAGTLKDSVLIRVIEDPGVGSFFVSTSTTFIEADSAEEVNVFVVAWLRDSFGQGLPHEPIVASVTGGTIPQSLSTNGNGVCYIEWHLRDEFGIFRLAAEYEPWGVRDTLMIEIRHTP